MKKKIVNKGGKPPFKIDSAMCDKTEILAAQGLTMEQIASVLGMGQTTLYKNKKNNTNFAKAIKKGQSKGLANVTNALFTQAMGGNITAMIFYLKNRDPENWEDVQKRHYFGKGNEALFPKEYKIKVVHTDKIKKE